MKNTIIILTLTLFSIGSSNYLVAQDKSTPSEEKDKLFGSSFYLDAGAGVGYNTGLWSGYPYSAFMAKAGSRWKLKGYKHSTYNLGIQITWATVSFNKGYGFPYGIGFAGIGISNMFRAKNNLGFEVNVNLIPNGLKSSKNNRYFGPMGNLELRVRYKNFFLGLDSGILINIGSGGMVYGGYTGVKLGGNLFFKKR